MKTKIFMLFGVPIEVPIEDESATTPTTTDTGAPTSHGSPPNDQNPPAAPTTSRRRRNDGKETVNCRRKRVKLDLPRQLPLAYREKIESMGGRDVRFVIRKQLYGSDVSSHLCRLTLPRKQILDHDFLDEEEKCGLQEKKGELKVKIIEPSMKESELVMKKWPQDPKAKGWSYVLTGDWQRVRESCGLLEAEKNAVQIWSFRYDIDKLGMVLLKYETGNSSSATTS